MATSGSISTNKYTTSSGKTIGLKLSWSLKSQSIANNTSTISWTLQSEGTYPSGSWVYAGPVTATINGTKVVNTTSRFEMKGDGGYKKTGTLTITHTTDGSKTFSASVKAAIYSSSVNCTKSGSWTLTKINRYALITEYPNFTDEENPTITFTNPGQLSTDIQARLKWMNGETEVTTAWSSVLSDEGGTYTFNLDSYRNAMRSACPDSNTLSVTYDIKSILNEVEYHDTKSAAMNIVNANPVIASDAITYLDTDSSVVTKTGGNNQIIVQGQGSLRISVNMTKVTAQKSAYINSGMYNLAFNGNLCSITVSGNILYADIPQPDVAGSVPTTLTVYDSRLNQSTYTIYIPICELSAPSATYTLVRKDNFDTPTTLTVNASFSSVSNTNTLTIKEKHKQVGTTTWSSETTITNNTPTIIQLTKEYDYDVQLTLYDEYYTSDDQTAVYHKTIYTTVVSKGTPLMFFDKKRHSVSVNGYPDENEQFYVDGSIKATGPLTSEARNITSEYTLTRSSGNWYFVEWEAWRTCNMVELQITFRGNGSAVGSGSNGIVGTVSGPLPVVYANIVGFADARPISGYIDINGNIVIRNTTTTEVKWTTNSRVRVTTTFITAGSW